MYYYINNFYIFGFIGYIFELLQGLIFRHKFINNILFEPIKPVYGVGIVFVIVIERTIFNNLKISKKSKLLLVFITSFVILTLLEYLTGITLEKTIHKSLWDYRHFLLNIGRYISVEVSSLWGIISVLFVRYIQNKTDKIIKKIPVWFSNIMVIITVTDILLSIIL